MFLRVCLYLMLLTRLVTSRYNSHCRSLVIRMQSTPSGGRASAAVSQGISDNKKKAPMDLAPPKGTRDFYPDDHRYKSWLFGKWRSIAALYGFEEYDAPVVESEDLYIRKAGEEVTQQLYNFEDKGGRRLSLRPEMTPSLARMVLAKKNALSFPLKWFSIPQCWRYERMTRGRRREHYQWNMDIWGVSGIEAEAELLSAAITSFQQMGITSQDVGIKINSRKLVTSLMTSLAIPEDKWAATCVLVDKLEKVPLDSLTAEFEALGLARETVQSLVESMKLQKLEDFEKLLGADNEGVSDLRKLFQLAKSYGYSDWLIFDATVIRGLAYYTGIVFEGFDRKGELRAICGGGRYDKLLESMGGDSVPAVGFGFGDAVITELLLSKGLLPDTSKSTVDVVVYAMDEGLREKATGMAAQLRAANVKADLILEEKKAKWVFQKADKIGASVVVMFASEEAKSNNVVIKSLKDGVQSVHNDQNVVAAVHELISQK